MTAPSPLLLLLLVGFAGALIVWLVLKSRRRTHPVPHGHRPEITFPHEAEFELYHNALSLCSMKSRLCMAELGIPYVSHHIDLIETGCYENIRPRMLRINPAGTVPVLIHNGHPIYESHEQIRYAAEHAPTGSPQLVPEDPAIRAEMEAWIDRASLTEDPIEHGDESAANAIPALTFPLFCTMIEKIPYWKIFEGFLFHFDKRRPLLFTTMKILGIERINKLAPAGKVLSRARRQMATHLDALEQQLAASGGPWLLGDAYTLADVSWLVVLERLEQGDILHLYLAGGQRPHCGEYWERLQKRPGYHEAILGHPHPFIEHGTRRIQEAKRNDPTIRSFLEGETRARGSSGSESADA